MGGVAEPGLGTRASCKTGFHGSTSNAPLIETERICDAVSALVFSSRKSARACLRVITIT